MKMISMHDNVKVKLTSLGRKIYLDSLRDINWHCGKKMVEVKPKPVDENGLTEFELWEFITLFSDEYDIGRMHAMNTLLASELYIEDSSIKDVDFE